MENLNKLLKFFVVVFFAVYLCSCRNHKEYDALASFLGCEIEMPDNLPSYIQDSTLKFNLSDTNYKIITYIDSAGCTSCKMKLLVWDEFINSLKSNEDFDVDFIMILNSIQNKDISDYIKKVKFRHPICFDPQGLFDSINSLPEGEKYHTILIDENNEVVVVGNPVSNPKIKALYQKALIGEKTSNPAPANQNSYACGIIKSGEMVSHTFTIYNTSDEQLTIQEIIPSCFCVNTHLPCDSILPYNCLNVEMTFVADSLPGKFRHIVDVFYNERELPDRLVLHGFIQ